METEKPYIVYVKVDESGYITAVNSSPFLPDLTGWLEIDSGFGDKYLLAQGNYFTKAIMTECGAYCYKLVEGSPVACSAEEITEQEADNLMESGVQSQEERIAELETQNKLLMQYIQELSEAVYC